MPTIHSGWQIPKLTSVIHDYNLSLSMTFVNDFLKVDFIFLNSTLSVLKLYYDDENTISKYIMMMNSIVLSGGVP